MEPGVSGNYLLVTFGHDVCASLRPCQASQSEFKHDVCGSLCGRR